MPVVATLCPQLRVGDDHHTCATISRALVD
jgi:hypothetical protein